MPENKFDSVVKNARCLSLGALIILVCAGYLFKLFSMQVLGGDEYRKQSQSISRHSVEIPAQRGEIFARDANFPIVVNTDAFAVDLTPAEIPEGYYDTVAARLARLLGITKAAVDKRVPVSMRRGNNFSAIEVKGNVPFAAIANIAENVTDLPGVSWRLSPTRNYLSSGSMSHILGYVGNISSEERRILYNDGYRSMNAIVGKAGIERQYDSLLQGQPGVERRMIDSAGRRISDQVDVIPPKMGKSLVLTIDSSIQTLVEKALGERVGAAIVLKPASGEVLAMVSYPYFDANIFSTDDAGAEYMRLTQAPHQPLLNRAVSAGYAPASTFKVIMSTAMLAENAFPSERKVLCTGNIEYGGRVFHCHVKSGHGNLDLKHGLAQSCNVYYWTIGRDHLGVDKIAYYANEFGFGRSFNIDLPTQSSGFVPTPAWKERKWHFKWLGGDTLNMSIGQSDTLATPMHVANMMAMIANSGVIYRPHLLKKVLDPATGETISETQPEVLIKSEIPRRVWTEVQADLRYTVSDGSAMMPLKNRVVRFAGKTGTAEVAEFSKQWHSWFVAYGPYEGPPEDQVVVVVLVEAVNPWEWWAPYASNIIFQGIFAHQTYEEALAALGPTIQHVSGARRE